MCLCLGKCVVRYFLVSINLIFFFIGAAIAIAGGILLYQLRTNSPLDVQDYDLEIILVIVLGCVIAFISAMGWCGACAEKKVLLYIYSGIVVVLAALHVYAVVKLRSADVISEDKIINSLEKTFNDTSQRETFHVLESTFKCCGPTGPESYIGVYDQLPPSCCVNATIMPDLGKPVIVDQIGSKALSCSIDDAHLGCSTVLMEFLKMVVHYLGLGFIVVIAVELLAIVLALSLSCCIAPKTG
ncbi:23 kDa integral membrane protein-like [Pieris napi]|uniref:23 kDa integral membrane protein-like n=1 Tax=Pieris napi TaxID=78633 RepID=UPI001FB9C315|nr:23 kDa integral membrane protein-like [Pieris napi]